jgi:ketosteroid isomerase-like protein
MSQANIDIAKNSYAAFGRGDIAAILAVLADDIVWVVPGVTLPSSGRFEGKAAVANFFQSVGTTWSFTAFEPREYIPSGDLLVVIGRYAGTSRATGKPFDSDWVMCWRFRDGKLAHFQEFTDTELLAATLK